MQLLMSFLKNLWVQIIIAKLDEKVIWLLLNNNYTSQNYKYRASSSLEVTHMYSSHQDKKIWLVISYQTHCLEANKKCEFCE